MIDHVSFRVADLGRSRRFYEIALKPLGIEVLWEVPGNDGSPAAVGLGSGDRPYFWLGARRGGGTATHIAFTADSRQQVREFYEAALSAGGTDNGAPGLRPQYDENYFGAFVLDPEGFNVEAVCHKPEESSGCASSR